MLGPADESSIEIDSVALGNEAQNDRWVFVLCFENKIILQPVLALHAICEAIGFVRIESFPLGRFIRVATRFDENAPAFV